MQNVFYKRHLILRHKKIECVFTCISNDFSFFLLVLLAFCSLFFANEFLLAAYYLYFAHVFFGLIPKSLLFVVAIVTC